MAYKSNGKGSFIIDRRFEGVGEIRRASGTDDPDVHRAIAGERVKGGGRTPNMLDELKGAGRTDLLELIRDDKVSAVNLWHRFRLHGISLQFTPESVSPLAGAVDAWLDDPKTELEQKTKDNYRYMLKALASPRSTVSDLTELLRKARPKMSDRRRLFNHTRSAAQAFVRDTQPKGRHSELWRDISAIPIYTVTRKRGNPQPVERARPIAERLGVDGQVWWTLCCTGMGWKEYTRDGWDTLPDRIRVYGQKRDARGKEAGRVLPRICTPVRATCSEKIFAKRLAKAALDLGYGHVTIRDARRSYSLWMKIAKVPKIARDSYMGHKAGDLDALYGELGESALDHFLPQHAALLREYVGEAPALMKVMA